MKKHSSSHPAPVQETTFPARVYSETVLAVNFEDSKKYFLEALLEIHAAHTLMLARQGIITTDEAGTCLRALQSLDRQAIRSAVYDGSSEDLFFYIEQQLARCCDAEIAGKMHTARSRNDIDLTLYRMCLRRELLKLIDAVLQVRHNLLALAAEHVDTVVPAYTHTQPAQPTTLAHYLMAAVEFLGRDVHRLQAAFATVNRSPLGACAITTTGFPIDREYTADLLGFEGLQVNSYGAIAAVDYLTETAAVVATAMVNLGKLVQDLLLWCTKEFGFLRLTDAYVQVSSIMPQKRNPVSLEHTRILASKALAQAQGVLTCAHNTPFGDIVDSEDDLQPLAFAMFNDAERALRLFAAIVKNVNIDAGRTLKLANDNFLTVTELADTLVRRERLSFRLAHHLVSQAVKESGPKYDPEQMIAAVERLAPEVVGRNLSVGREELLRALDAENFVRVRNIVGGPAREAVSSEIERAQSELRDAGAWLERKITLMNSYRRQLADTALAQAAK